MARLVATSAQGQSRPAQPRAPGNARSQNGALGEAVVDETHDMGQ